MIKRKKVKFFRSCGATRQQKELAAAQKSFYDTMRASYGEVFGADKAILSSLTSSLTPILERGPSAKGMDPAEEAALRTQAAQATGAAYKQAAGAVGEQLAARGGGNAFLPSGTEAQIREELASEAVTQNIEKQLGITERNYDIGRQQYWMAEQGLAGAPSVMNSAAGFAGEATGAGSSAEKSAADVAAASKSWMGLLGGLAGGAMGMFKFGK
jgi:hypothetical protein